MSARRCRHKAATEVTVGYRGPVGPHDRQRPEAHGGVCHVETCRCGAKRRTNSNGGRTETSGWVVEEES
jgi:hypothetical protein